jgi:hypothetical protein
VHLWLTSTNIYPYLTFNVIWAILYFHLCLIFGQVLFHTSMTNILFIFFYLKCHNLTWNFCWEIVSIILKWPFLCWSKLCSPSNWGLWLCYTLGCDGASLLDNCTLLLLYFGQEIRNYMRCWYLNQSQVPRCLCWMKLDREVQEKLIHAMYLFREQDLGLLSSEV